MLEKYRQKQRAGAVQQYTALLQRHGIPFELIYENPAELDWLRANYPIAGGVSSPQIDWPNVALYVPGPDGDATDDEVRSWLRQLVIGRKLTDGDVVLIFGNTFNPSIRLPFKAVVQHPVLASGEGESWIVSLDQQWVLEFRAYLPGWSWGRP